MSCSGVCPRSLHRASVLDDLDAVGKKDAIMVESSHVRLGDCQSDSLIFLGLLVGSPRAEATVHRHRLA